MSGDRDIVADTNDALDSRPGDLLSVERVRARRDRQHSAQDRDSAAHDRSRALSDRYMSGSDRSHAADDRSAAERAMSWFREQLDRAEDDAEDMLVIGQAQGQVMQAQDVGAYEALMAVFNRAAKDGVELSAAAQSLIGDTHRLEHPRTGRRPPTCVALAARAEPSRPVRTRRPSSDGVLPCLLRRPGRARCSSPRRFSGATSISPFSPACIGGSADGIQSAQPHRLRALRERICYNFNQAGLLVVHPGPDGGRLTYSPHARTVVEEPDGDGNYHRQSGRFSQE